MCIYMTYLPDFRCYVSFANNVTCACHEQLPSLRLLEYLAFVTFFVLSTEDQESRKRIGLDSNCCPWEELTRRKSRYWQNSKVIHSVTLTLTSITRCWLSVFHSRKCDLSRENVSYGICSNGRTHGMWTDDKRIEKPFKTDAMNGWTASEKFRTVEDERLNG